jgi:hypothetical protein
MDEHKLNWPMLALVAFAGALILEVILTFAAGLKDTFTASQIPAHLAALLVGSLAGFLFELLRQMTGATNQATRKAADLQESIDALTADIACQDGALGRTRRRAADLEVIIQALTAKISYQDEALGMLRSCPRHNEALTSLIKASMSADKAKIIPFVDVPRYLDFLKKAIDRSDSYEGIQRKPFSWYKQTGAGAYLSDLKNRDMKYKKRLLIIDESDEMQMQADLADASILEYYWSHTGAVATYWITSTDFKAKFPPMEIPEDLALYDKQLLIAFSEQTRILTFDVIDLEHRVRQVFDAVDGLISRGFEFLHQLPMPELVRK